MFAGHAALALFAKGNRPRIPLALLLAVAFAPDWIEWIFAAFGHRNREFSHSLVSIGIGATVAALIYGAARRDWTAAAVVWLTYASHWPADFITARKPTWPGGPTVGLAMYTRPIADAAIEFALIGVCWLVYRRSIAATSRMRTLSPLIPLGLVVAQIIFLIIISPAQV